MTHAVTIAHTQHTFSHNYTDRPSWEVIEIPPVNAGFPVHCVNYFFFSCNLSLILQSQTDISPWEICPLAPASSVPLSTSSPQKSLPATVGYLKSSQVGTLIFLLLSDVLNSHWSHWDGHDCSKDLGVIHCLRSDVCEFAPTIAAVHHKLKYGPLELIYSI